MRTECHADAVGRRLCESMYLESQESSYQQSAAKESSRVSSFRCSSVSLTATAYSM